MSQNEEISILELIQKCDTMFDDANEEIEEIDFDNIHNFEKAIRCLEDKTEKLYELTTVLRKIKEYIDRVSVLENNNIKDDSERIVTAIKKKELAKSL